VALPAVRGTIARIAFVGQSCATAVLTHSAVKTMAATRLRAPLVAPRPARMADVRMPAARLRIMSPPVSFFEQMFNTGYRN
jgi:hypothetical protein